MSRRVLIGIVVGALALLLAGGAVLASPLLNSRLGVAAQTTATPAPNSGAGQQRGRQHGKAARFVRLLADATAQVSGVQWQDVTQGLRAGKSLAQIAQEHGKTGDDILAKLREQGQQRLDKALDRARELIDQPGLGR